MLSFFRRYTFMDIRILLVEDDEHICNAVKVFLSGAGYKV
ncbi:DNA-binding response regulator, partial [Bacillus cereus]